MARADGVSITETLDRIIESQRRQRLLDQVNDAYERLRGDEEAWAQERAERQEMEGTLMDGLDGDPYSLKDRERSDE